MTKYKYLQHRDGCIVIHRRVKVHEKQKYHVGAIFESKNYGKYKIMFRCRNIITIEFIDTGYIRTLSIRNLMVNEIKDYRKITVCGIGFLGDDYVEIKNSDKEKLMYRIRDRWKNMLERCYRESSPYYNIYGGAGVTVDKRWHNFSNFYHDVQKLDGWNEDLFLKRKLYLDKDKLQFNKPPSKKVYSKDTCVWLSAKENNMYISNKHETTFKVIYPDGKSEIHTGVSKFAREHNLDQSSIRDCMNGKLKTHKKHKFIRID